MHSFSIPYAAILVPKSNLPSRVAYKKPNQDATVAKIKQTWPTAEPAKRMSSERRKLLGRPLFEVIIGAVNRVGVRQRTQSSNRLVIAFSPRISPDCCLSLLLYNFLPPRFLFVFPFAAGM